MQTSADNSKPLVGALWMLATGFCFVGVTATVKVVGDSLPAAQAAFLRYVLGLVFLIPMIGPMRATRWTREILLLGGARGVVHTLGVAMWFFAMARIPMAEVTAMGYLTPVYVTIGAAIFLGERLAARRIAAVVAALVGAAIILRPGLREIGPGHTGMLFTAVMFAASYLLTGKLSGKIGATAIVGMLSVTVTIGLAPLAFAVWIPPTLEQLVWLFIVAALATAGHYTMTRAFAVAPLSVTQPVTFLQLVWSVLLGWALFAEAVDVWVIVGGVVIMAAASFIALREAQLRREGRV
ncbi:peptide ABC transporter permease [Actibacterium mucosum KCTC 23349]|uniref:Peptide ABC transporter permease n=1 Tax=Actibacterium mucosum KCTC 23349 TaxID=1454373 RepID=A0A037ZJ91_9RHOB|nr:DMT family transporter [Actibacterium mucosum]KAJ56490.1 peptide ABC transporter permease [Actibacterium mucosum KCTC 23349]